MGMQLQALCFKIYDIEGESFLKYLVGSSLAAVLSVFTFAIYHLISFGSFINFSTFYIFTATVLMFAYIGGLIGFLYLYLQKNKSHLTNKNFLVFLAIGLVLGIVLEWVVADGHYIGFLMASIVGSLTFLFANGIESLIIRLIIIPLPFIVVFGFPLFDKF